jgi:hypothetical protein
MVGKREMETAAVMMSRFFVMALEKEGMIADCVGELKL